MTRVHAYLMVGIAIAAFVANLAACGSDEPTGGDLLQDPSIVGRYRAYLEPRAEEFVSHARQLLKYVDAGEIAAAESRYGEARVRYGQLKPAAKAFALAQAIDGRPGGPVNRGEGLHRIERSLWVTHDTSAVTPVAKQLLSAVEALRRRITGAPLSGRQIIAGALATLDEVSILGIRGKEEPNSNIDLVDIAADVEGAEAAYKAMAPVVAEVDPQLGSESHAKFDAAYAYLRNFGWAAREPGQPRASSPGTSFVLHYERSRAEFRELNRRILAVREQLERVRNRLAE